MNVGTALRRMGGVARYSVLLAVGVSRGDIRRALADGTVQRPLRGCIALPTTPFDQVLACYFDARISCLSAVVAHGLRVLKVPDAPHLELHAERGGHARASTPHRLVHLHRSRGFETGATVVPVERAIDVASHCTSALGQLVMIDHALAKGVIELADLNRFVITPLRTRRWLQVSADARSGSVPETCARVALRAAGLKVETQAPLGDGRYADLLVEGRVYVETDGYEFHAHRRQFEEDRARDRYLMARGYRVLRFPYGDAVHAPARLVGDVIAALEAPVR